MKKSLGRLLFAMLLSAFLFLLLCVSPASAEKEVYVPVYVGGQKLICDVPATIIENRTMLPLRAVFEAIGATVSWEDSTRTVTAQKENTTVQFTIGSNIMLINGDKTTIDVPAMIKNDRTLVPLRACAEAFSIPVEWNNEYRFVKVKIPVNQVVYKEYIDRNWERSQYDEDGNEFYWVSSRGIWRKYRYDAAGNVISMEDSDGNQEKRQYDAYGNLISLESDLEGNIEYQYDEAGHLICEIYPNENRRITYHYDAAWNLMKKEGTDGFLETYSYDDRGNLISVVESEEHWTKYRYDADCNRIYEETSDGNWTKYRYDEQGNLEREDHKNGDSIRYRYQEFLK